MIYWCTKWPKIIISSLNYLFWTIILHQNWVWSFYLLLFWTYNIAFVTKDFIVVFVDAVIVQQTISSKPLALLNRQMSINPRRLICIFTINNLQFQFDWFLFAYNLFYNFYFWRWTLIFLFINNRLYFWSNRSFCEVSVLIRIVLGTFLVQQRFEQLSRKSGF